MKKLLVLLLATACAASLAACGGAQTQSSTAAASSQTGSAADESAAATGDEALADKITVAVPRGSYVTYMNEVAVPAFIAENPGVAVDVIADTDIETMIAAGEYPNVYTGGYGARGMRYAKSGALVPLNTMPGYDELAARVGPDFMTTYADYNFYMPWNLTTTMMVYNKDLFKQAGLDPENPPKTFDEFLSAAKAIDDLGDDIYGTVFWNEALPQGGWYWNMLAPIYYNFNQGKYQLLNANGTDIVFDNPEAKMAECIDFMAKAQESAPASMHDDGSVGFFRRNIGMWLQFGYGWTANFAEAEGKPMEIGVDVGIAPIPVPNAGDTAYSTMDANGLIIFKTNEQEQLAAWKFIQTLMEDDVNLEACKRLGQLPALLSLKDNEFFKQDSVSPFVQQTANTVKAEPYAEADTTAAILQAKISAVMIDKSMSAEDAVKQAADEARAALQK